jgi:hypothetical protein
MTSELTWELTSERPMLAPPSSGLLHVVCASLRPDIDGAVRESARALARGLVAAPGARSVIVGESATHLLVATWLAGRDALEGFAASAPHMAFIMRGVAAVTSGMWSAAVETNAAPPEDGDLEGLGVFGLRAAAAGAQLYEWQVRALIDELERLPAAVAAGPTFEERDRFRAAGAFAVPAGGRATFDEALAGLDAARALGEAFVTAVAPVVAWETA